MSKRKPSQNFRGIVLPTGEKGMHKSEVANTKLNDLIELTYGSLKQYTERFTWRNIGEAISIAMSYARGGSELIQTAILTKIEFYAAGFKIKINPGRESMTASLNERITEWMKKHDIRQICDDLLFDLLAADNCVLMWQVSRRNGRTIDYVTTLPPDTVIYHPGTNGKRLGIRITEELKTEVLKAIADGKSNQWSPKILDAVKTGKPEVMFDEAEGEFWILKSRGPKFAGLRQPSMRSIFADIQLRELLVSGDWSTAYFTKNFITLVTMGESIKNGPYAGTRNLYPTRPEMMAVQDQFTKIGTTMRLYGNQTLNVKYIYPDQTVLGNEKYAGVERRIGRWTRVPDVMLTGEGDGYAQGSLGKRSFEAQGERIREDLDDLFREFFSHPSVMKDPTLNLPTKSTVKATFNKQILKDPKQVLDETKFLNDAGMIDVQTTLENMGLDYDEIKERKAQDEKDRELWKPVFEKAQGMSTPGNQDDNLDNGRPTKSGGSPKVKESPRPSKGQ